eukprot:scaffold14999_cov155-Skeletonema_dohrnii-CCMP3373.AAC.5
MVPHTIDGISVGGAAPMNDQSMANKSPREGPSAEVEEQQLHQQHGGDIIANNCQDVAVDNNIVADANNNTSSEAAADAAAHSSSMNSATDDTIIKERPRPILPQSAAVGSSNDATTANNTNDIASVGAHHVNESAPNINRRFFNGMTNRNARMRAREERRLQREEHSPSNNGETTTSSSQPPQQQPTESRRNLLTRTDQSNRSLSMSTNNDDDFNSSSQSMSRMHQSRRNLFSRRASNSNILHENNEDHDDFNSSSQTMSRMSSRRNLFSRMTSHSNLLHNNHHHNNMNALTQSIMSQTHSITATLVDDDNVVVAEAFDINDILNNNNVTNNDANNIPLPDSEVGRIISRLEYRNTHRVPVSSDVKWRFLRLCDEACVRRVKDMRETMDLDNDDDDDEEEDENGSVGSYSRSSNGSDSDGSSSQDTDALQPTNQKNTNTTTTSSPCILREDVIQIRNTVRLAYESRTKIQRFQKLARSIFGFRDVDKVLLNVLNRAVDSIDESGHVEAKKRRAITRRASVLGRTDSLNLLNQSGVMMPMTTLQTCQSGGSLSSNPSGMLLRTNSSRLDCGGGGGLLDDSNRSFGSQLHDDGETVNTKGTKNNMTDDERLEWFYYKDFAFYNLKVESKYPWVRNAGLFSLFVTMMFLLFTPILWCVILRDEK